MGQIPDKYWIKIILIKVKNVKIPCSVVCRAYPATLVDSDSVKECIRATLQFLFCLPPLVNMQWGDWQWDCVSRPPAGKHRINSLSVRPGKVNGSKVFRKIITSDGLICHFLILWLPTLADDIQIYVGDLKMLRCWDVDALWMIYFDLKSCNVNWQSSDWTKSQFDRDSAGDSISVLNNLISRDKVTDRINVIHLHHKNTMSLVFTQLATFQCCLSCPDTSNTITIPTRLTIGGEGRY